MMSLQDKRSQEGQMEEKEKEGIMRSKSTAILVVAGILLAAAVISFITYQLILSQVKSFYTDLAFNSARMAAEIVSGDDLDFYLEQGENESYRETFTALQTLKRTYSIEFLYIIRPETDRRGGIFIFDVYLDDKDPELFSGLGDRVSESDLDVFDYDVVLKAFIEGITKDSTVVTDTRFGHLASAYVPVFAPDGSISAVACVDISMDVILREVRSQFIQISVIILAVSLVFSLVILWLILRLKAKRIEHERITTELNVASNIQTSMLPRSTDDWQNGAAFDIYAKMLPAKQIGGDFYDFFMIGKDKLAVVIADVSGKGIPAALFMAISKAYIKSVSLAGKTPKEVFQTVNSLLCENNDAGMFVTAFLGHLDLPSGKLIYSNAGHNPPLLRAGNNGNESRLFKLLETEPEYPLACMDEASYNEHEVALARGAELFLYTDGITEAENTDKEPLGEKRLIDAVNSNNLPPKEIIEALLSCAKEYSQGVEQADDITMLMLKYG
jgi:serine phosphatase RsbU (regulator of sigma subunit)